MDKAKTKLMLLTLLIGMVTTTFGIWFYFSAKQGLELRDLILVGPVILVLLLIIPLITRSLKSIKEKTPLEDERMTKAKTKAASLAFYISIYLLLAIGYLGDGFFERPSQATGAGVMGMAIIFLLAWLYFERKSNL